MKAIQTFGNHSVRASKDFFRVFLTAPDASASELLLRGAAVPIVIWACLFASLEWLA